MLGAGLLVGWALVLCVSQQTSAYFSRGYSSQRGRHPALAPRCSTAASPCRLRAEMMEINPLKPPGRQTRRVTTRLLCSCPPSSPCSSNWSSPHHDRLITRQLRTSGKLNMTFSLMFCSSLVPSHQELCGPGDVALSLKGYPPIPTGLESYNCACTDSRPLVLHRRHIGPDFLQQDDFVCSSHKRRCNVDWNPDVCMVHVAENHTDLFPCKCPDHYECREADSLNFRCQPIQYDLP